MKEVFKAINLERKNKKTGKSKKKLFSFFLLKCNALGS